MKNHLLTMEQVIFHIVLTDILLQNLQKFEHHLTGLDCVHLSTAS